MKVNYLFRNTSHLALPAFIDKLTIEIANKLVQDAVLHEATGKAMIS